MSNDDGRWIGEYLIKGHGKGKGKARAHLWTGSDTVCRMWSTGGLEQPNYSVHSDLGGHEVCSMCRSVFARENAERDGGDLVFVTRARARLDRELELEQAAAKRSEPRVTTGSRHVPSDDDDSVPSHD